MYRVTKRDGSITEFHIAKIGNAITRAFEAVGRQQHPSVIELLALRVTAEFEPKIRNELISVEDIQDCVERVLSEAGYSDVAKAYILYRKQREKLRNVGSTLLNYKELVDNYLRINDWRVKENSTVTYSVGGLILSNSGAITANYWLSEIYDAEIAQAHRNAELHLHDLSMLTGYCAGWSLRQLIQEGLGGVPGKISSSPASHLSTLCNQMVNFLGIMQNEWAGAQAFSSFDTYLAPFVRVDKLTQREVKQCVQSFVYGVNTPSRWGTQAPFSNITLDWTVPKDMANLPAIVGGQEQPFTDGAQRLGSQLPDDLEHGVRAGFFANALLRARACGEKTREILLRERLHGVIGLIGDDGGDNAVRPQLPQQLRNAGIGLCKVRAVDGVIGVERRENGVDLRLVRPGRDGAHNQLPDAVADERAHLRKRSGRKALRGKGVVEPLPQIGQRVEQRPVQIKNCKLIHRYNPRFRLFSMRL